MCTWIPSKSNPSFEGLANRHPDLKLENKFIMDVYQWVLKKQWKKESQCLISGNSWISIWFQSKMEHHLLGFLDLIRSRRQYKNVSLCCPWEMEVYTLGDKHWNLVQSYSISVTVTVCPSFLKLLKSQIIVINGKECILLHLFCVHTTYISIIMSFLYFDFQ